jgi:hypothetical protein
VTAETLHAEPPSAELLLQLRDVTQFVGPGQATGVEESVHRAMAVAGFYRFATFSFAPSLAFDDDEDGDEDEDASEEAEGASTQTATDAAADDALPSFLRGRQLLEVWIDDGATTAAIAQAEDGATGIALVSIGEDGRTARTLRTLPGDEAHGWLRAHIEHVVGEPFAWIHADRPALGHHVRRVEGTFDDLLLAHRRHVEALELRPLPVDDTSWLLAAERRDLHVALTAASAMGAAANHAHRIGLVAVLAATAVVLRQLGWSPWTSLLFAALGSFGARALVGVLVEEISPLAGALLGLPVLLFAWGVGAAPWTAPAMLILGAVGHVAAFVLQRTGLWARVQALPSLARLDATTLRRQYGR